MPQSFAAQPAACERAPVRELRAHSLLPANSHAYAQIALDNRLQCLTWRCSPCNLLHPPSCFLDGPCHRLDEQVVLALEMPIESTLFQAHLFQHGPDAARVAAALAERTRRRSKNSFVIPGFVFGRISHG